jgi:integrase
VQPLTPAEIRLLLEHVEGDRLEALYVLALATGLRQGELLGLGWPDVDLSAGVLTVRRSLQRVNGVIDFVEPKTLRSRRTVSVPASVGDLLRRHRQRQAGERLKAGSVWQENDLVFTTGTGRPLDGTNVTRRFQRLLAAAGIPQRRFHDLRHSCATVLLAQGVAARVVMEILGHSQILVTQNTYTHVLPEMHRDAARLMDGFLDGGRSSSA